MDLKRELTLLFNYYSLFRKGYKMKEPMRVYYDEKGDFLEISIGMPTRCYAIEVEQGVFLRKDEKTEEVKSTGILGFLSLNIIS